jgi:HNH endonuclease
MTSPWSKRDERLLLSIYPWLPIEEVGKCFPGRTLAAIKSRAGVLGATKAIGNGGRRRWTKREERILRELYPDTKSEKLARRFGVRLHVLYQHARRLGLRKSSEYLRSPEALFLVRNPELGAKYRFPKGHVPANKGLRRPGYAPGRMASTQFRKGQQPINTFPMWSFRMVDGYLMLKTGKVHTPPCSGWEYVHKLIWEQANGPVPDWRVARLWWKDGDHSNCSLSNLELLSSVEHMRRTTIHNLPPALKQVIQLTGALKRKIRNREEKLNGKEHAAGSPGPLIRNPGVAEGPREAYGN